MNGQPYISSVLTKDAEAVLNGHYDHAALLHQKVRPIELRGRRPSDKSTTMDKDNDRL